MLMAAYLHDTVEDTGVHIDEIKARFGEVVASLVSDLTDVSVPSDGNRSVRKAIDLAHTKLASPKAKTIKLADLISNTSTIVKHDYQFARIYLAEKAKLLEVLKEGDPALWARAKFLLDDGLRSLDGNHKVELQHDLQAKQ
jgi:(p)ppGpp synthase/HD superfamily hydrolase